MIDSDAELCECYLAASAALDRGDVASARRTLENLVLDYPRFAPAWDGLGNCHEAEGELQKAGECFRRAIRLDRNNWLSRFHWGAALHRSGELREACKLLKSAARIATRERCVLQELGACYYDLGQWDEALRQYRKALELPEKDVLDVELYVAIGNTEVESGNLDGAEDAFERACLISPNDPNVFYHWSLLSIRQGDLDGAERLAIRARALEPRSFRAGRLLLTLALDRADWSVAEKRIEEIAASGDRARLACALRAELAQRRGERDRARGLVLETLMMEGSPSDQAVDTALAALRSLNGRVVSCRGFRLVVEVDCGEEAYFRPYVVLAEDEERARWCVAELQDALDPSPWQIIESDLFEVEGEALEGVYQLLLTRVLFARDQGFPMAAQA